MYPVLFSIGQFKLYSFGSFIALGALVAGYFLYKLTRERKLPTSYLFDLVLYCLLAGLIGARVGYYVLYHEQFQNIWQVLYFWQGGLVALAGLIAGFIAFVYLVRQQKTSLWTALDIGILSLLAGWAIGKFGCHLSSCIVGKPGNFLTINGLYPVDLFSSVWAVIVGVVLFRLYKQQKLREGVIFFIATEALLLGELIIKTLKADFGQGISQLEAGAYLALIIAVYLVFWRLHGPKIDRNKVAASTKKLLGRIRR